MIIDIAGRFVSWRIAGYTLRVGVLVDPNIIEAHCCRQGGGNACEVQGGKACGHAKVHDQSHGLLGYDPLPDIAIRTYSSGVEFPRCCVCY